MSTFIKDFIERETVSRRNFLLASAAGLGSMALPMAMGRDAAMAAENPALAWSYRDRASAYWNAVVSGGENFVESLGKTKADMTSLINEGSSEKSLSDIKAFLAKNNGNCAIACTYRLGGNGVANSTVFGGIAGDRMAAWVRREGAWHDADEAAIERSVAWHEAPGAGLGFTPGITAKS